MTGPDACNGILIVDWDAPPTRRHAISHTPTLVPLLGKCLLQRAVERLVSLGCRHIHVLIGDHPAEYRALLGEGERWGITIACHYLDDELPLGQYLRRLDLGGTLNYWLAMAETLPDLEEESPPRAPCALCWQDYGHIRWSGWGCFSGAWLLGSSACNRESLERQVLADPAITQQATDLAPLSASSDSDLLSSTLRLLDCDPTGMHIGRGCSVHPTATLTGPVHLGEFVRVGAGVHLGPHTVVSDHALIDRNSRLDNCLVLSDTYVGADLEISHAIAAPGRLSSISNDTVLPDVDPGFLAAVSRQGEDRRPSATRRTALHLLKALSTPLYWVLCAVDSRPVPRPETTVALPGGRHVTLPVADTAADLHMRRPGAWVSHYVHTFHPGLASVMAGQLHLTGPELRDMSALNRLPTYWRDLYEYRAPGLISESLLLKDADNHVINYFSSDACSIAPSTVATTLRLLTRYVARVLLDAGQQMGRQLCGQAPQEGIDEHRPSAAELDLSRCLDSCITAPREHTVTTRNAHHDNGPSASQFRSFR